MLDAAQCLQQKLNSYESFGSRSPYDGFRFPAAVINCAVRWYHRFSPSLRDIEELLLERGVTVIYYPYQTRSTVREVLQKPCPLNRQAHDLSGLLIDVMHLENVPGDVYAHIHTVYRGSSGCREMLVPPGHIDAVRS